MGTCIIGDAHNEAVVIASVLLHPDYVFFSEELRPSHFTNTENAYIYHAVRQLASQGIFQVDVLNIEHILSTSKETKENAAKVLTKESIQDLIDHADLLARDSVEGYQEYAKNVFNAAKRRKIFDKLSECQRMCQDNAIEDIDQKVYASIDSAMLEFSNAKDIPQYKDVVDGYWEEIKRRQGTGYAGFPFKIPLLNEYATIERSELFIFGAEQKQGKSMMLLNCAIDLLKQNCAVLYLDSELNSRLFTARVLSHLSGVPYKRLRDGRYDINEEQRIMKAKEWMKTQRFTHIYIPSFDPQSIYATVKKVNHTQGIDVLIVDYFKGKGDGDAFDSYQELGRFVDMVKNQICGDMNIAGLGAAQATSTGKLADSAKIARNASTIAIITEKTPEEVEADGRECGNKKLRVVYNRNGEQMAKDEYIDLAFNGNLISYEQAAKQHVVETPY